MSAITKYIASAQSCRYTFNVMVIPYVVGQSAVNLYVMNNCGTQYGII